MIKMVCLANSWCRGGRCIAGIDLDTGEWIRPITRHGGAFPEATLRFGDHEIAPMDILEMDLAPPTMTTKYQRENRVLNSRVWKLVGRFEAKNLLPYCSRFPTVLHSPGRTVEPAALETLLPEKWRSLELRQVTALRFHPSAKKDNRWIADFKICGPIATHLALPLIDPVATAALASGATLEPECLLTLSLTEPTATPRLNLPELCYKYAAAVIRL
jgi:hypothetical protein